MASIINVLYESFELLRQRPEFFAPKLVSTVIGALWLVGLLSGRGPILFYGVTAPLMLFLGVFVSIMLAVMVKRKDEDEVLRKSLRETIGHWRELLLSSLFLFTAGTLLYIPFAGGFTIFYLWGSVAWLVAGIFLSLLLLLAFSFLVYFFPISLVEKGSVSAGFRDSARTSIGNSRDVAGLTLFSFALLGLASLAGDQNLRLLGYTGFVLARIVSGVITTYVFVVSPRYYLSD